jgi:uncharacterized membrane protein
MTRRVKTLRRLSVLAALAVFLLAARPGHAADAESEPLSVWKYSFYKALSFEVAAGVIEAPLYPLLLGGTVAAAGVFAVVGVTTALAAYYGQEVLWNLYGPSVQENPESALEVGTGKLATFWVMNTARNIVLVYAFTGAVTGAVTYAMIANAIDATVYAGNEYVWYAYGPSMKTTSVVAGLPVPTVLPRRSEPTDDAPGSVAIGPAAGIRKAAVYLGRAAVTATDEIKEVGAAAWSSLR